MILFHTVLDRMRRKAAQSHCRYFVSAVGFDHKGNAVAFGVNRPRFSKANGGRHAEMVVLEKGGNQIKSILICRIGLSGKLLPIHCCPSCKRVLERRKIKIYTVLEIMEDKS